MISLPTAARVLQLAQDTFTQLLAQSAYPNRLRGCFCGHTTQDTRIEVPENADDDVAMEALLKEQTRLQYYFTVTEPNLSQQHGPYFLTVFDHPQLQAHVRKLLRGADGNLWFDLTKTEDGFKATMVSPFDPTYTGDSAVFSFADSTLPAITWVKPVHDDAFLRRTLPNIVESVFRMDAPYWGCCASISLCKGIYLFAKVLSSPRVIALIDLDYHTFRKDPRVTINTHNNTAILTVPDIDGYTALRLYEDGNEYFLPYLRGTLSAEFGINLPDESEIRYFYWQRYVG